MILVTVELCPHGDEKQKQHLGTAKIWNDCTGTATRGNYKATLSKWGRPGIVWKGGQIKDFDRNKRGAWDLLYLVLKKIVGGRNDRL